MNDIDRRLAWAEERIRLQAFALIMAFAWIGVLFAGVTAPRDARRALSETPRVVTATPGPTPDMTATWTAVDATWEAHADELERRWGR